MSNVDLISQLYTSFGEGDVPTVLAMMASEIRWHEAEGSPYHTHSDGWTGPDAVVENLFSKMGDDWEMFVVQPGTLHAAGDTVVMEGRYAGKHRVTGKDLDCQVCHVWTIRDGKIVRFQQYVDTAQMQDVMG